MVILVLRLFVYAGLRHGRYRSAAEGIARAQHAMRAWYNVRRIQRKLGWLD